MDVEAQEDGQLFKITQQDGAKAVKVGARIAVLADSGDDLSSLEMPADAAPKQSATSERKEKAPSKDTKSSTTKKEAPAKSDTSSSKADAPSQSTNKPRSQKYPLYPSVQFALKENGLSKEDADKITATGPGGRLLKGDVLAYAGKIDKDYSASLSKRLSKLGHMDLSNIELAPAHKPSAAAQVAAEEELPQDTEIAMHISLSAVIATQKRVQDTLGITLPLSVFIARASELANEDLPLSAKKASADDLFYSVLGLDDVVPKSSRGNYFPLVTGLPASLSSGTPLPRKTDIFDELIGGKPQRAQSVTLPPLVGAKGVASTMNIFSVVARPGEEKRVEMYLEKMKLVLEAEPGRLVV